MRMIGRTGLSVPAIGYGAFKIGRNQGTKYSVPYELPSDPAVDRLLNSILDLGCNLIDTAPAYGISEQQIGRAIGHRRGDYVLSTKVGETFANGQSTFDFSEKGVRSSLERSLKNLRTDVLDIALIHSNGDDRKILAETDVVSILTDYRDRGIIRAIGLSGKTVEGAKLALAWADLLMVEYHMNDLSHSDLINEAAQAGIGVFVKKGLSSGKLPAEDSIRFVLNQTGVTSLIVGTLQFDHFKQNWQTAMQCRSDEQ